MCLDGDACVVVLCCVASLLAITQSQVDFLYISLFKCYSMPAVGLRWEFTSRKKSKNRTLSPRAKTFGICILFVFHFVLVVGWDYSIGSFIRRLTTMISIDFKIPRRDLNRWSSLSKFNSKILTRCASYETMELRKKERKIVSRM